MLSDLPPIFVISLVRAAARRASITSRLDAAGVAYEMVDAVDGEVLDLSGLADRLKPDQYRTKYRREFSRTEIGCYLSHYNLWQRIVDDKIDCAIILEDDAIWEEDFFEIVANLQKIKWHWELIGLSNGGVRTERIVCKLNNKRCLVRHKRLAFGAVAYIIRRSAAEKLLGYCYEICTAIDVLMYEYWKNNVVTYMVKPSPAPSLEQEPSTIEYKYIPRHELSLVETIKGSIHRKIDRLGRILYCLTHPPRKQKS